MAVHFAADAAMNAPNPASLYADHITVQRSRADEALARGGLDHLVVPSGSRVAVSVS